MKPISQTLLLLFLGSLPILAGAARVWDLALAAPQMDPSMGSRHQPGILVWHIVAASGFIILGALQGLPSLRRNAWHRRAGRIAALFGFVGAGTGLALVLILPADPHAGPLLVPLRLLFSALWIVALALAVVHIRARRVSDHRRWMVRAYAIAIGTGLQSLILLPYFFLVGVPVGLPADLVMLASWLLALAVGEWSLQGDRAVARPA